MARQANALSDEFESLWARPDAYRPPVELVDAPEPIPGIVALHWIADHAGAIGGTSGDAGVLGVTFLTAIDEHRSYTKALDLVIGDLQAGRMRSVAGPPLRKFLTEAQARSILEVVGSRGRIEAYVERVMQEPESTSTD